MNRILIQRSFHTANMATVGQTTRGSLIHEEGVIAWSADQMMNAQPL